MNDKVPQNENLSKEDDNVTATDNGDTKLSPEQRLNAIVSKMKWDEKEEKYILPDDVPEELKIAALTEKRRRDLQAKVDKLKLELAKKEATAKELETLALAKLDLTKEEQEELEELKYQDPEKWRLRLNELEEKKKNEIKQQLNEKVSKTVQELEKERREKILDQFLADNPDIEPDALYNDVPVRLKNQLEQGEISFEEYLAQAKNFITKGFQVDNRNPDLRNLSEMKGSSSVPDKIIEDEIIKSYQEEIF